MPENQNLLVVFQHMVAPFQWRKYKDSIFYSHVRITRHVRILS